MKNYKSINGKTLRSDIIAGFNVALLAFPQSIAYSAIAGLPLTFGIACSISAALIAPFFLSSRHTILGSTNATSFMIFSWFAVSSYTQDQKVALVPMIVFLVGVILITCSILRLADLVQYISHSVIIGYISGAAILIIVNQLKHIFSIYSSESGSTIFEVVWNIVKGFPSAHGPSIIISISVFFTYKFLSQKFKSLPNFAITLALFTAIAYFCKRIGWFELVTYDAFSLKALMPGNPIPDGINFFETLRDIFGVALAIAFLASLESSVMSKSLSSQIGENPDGNQDMYAQGIANITSSIFKGMPASGSLTRSALNFESGAHSQISNIASGLISLTMVILVAPLIEYLPKCVLATLIVSIALSLINIKQIKICFFSTRSDAIVLVSTFAAALLIPLHVAIFLGVGVSIMLYLRQASKPYLVEYEFNKEGHLEETNKRNDPFISIVHVEGELFFGASELFRSQIQRVAMDEGLRIIILRMKNAHHLDATSVMALRDLIKFLRKKGRSLIISGISDEVFEVLNRSGIISVIGKDNMFMEVASNPNICIRNALIRANQIMGDVKAEVKIYYDPNKDKK